MPYRYLTFTLTVNVSNIRSVCAVIFASESQMSVFELLDHVVVSLTLTLACV